MVNEVRRRGSGAWRWARRNPVPTAVAALVIAGASATAALSGTPVSAASYTGCGKGFDGVGYSFGYGTCSPSTGGSTGGATGGTPAGGGVLAVPPTLPPVTTTPPPKPTPTPSPKPTNGSQTASVTSATSATTLVASSKVGSAKVVVPAGALPVGTKLAVTPIADTGTLKASVQSGPTKSDAYVAAFSVSWVAPNGTVPKASAPITMTITDPSIKAGDVIYALVNGTLQKVGVAKVAGSATVTFSSDPTFVVLEPPMLGLANAVGKQQGTQIGLRFRCVDGAACAGSATLNVARREHGHLAQVFVGKGSFSLGQGQLSTVSFTPTAAGTALFHRFLKTSKGHVYVSYVMHVQNGPRQVGKILIRG